MFDLGPPPKFPRPALILPRPAEIIRPGDPRFHVPKPKEGMFVLNHLAGFGAGGSDSGSSGGNDANTKLLLHCDGTNGSTTFTDSSSSAVSVTANSPAQVSTSQSKFGGASFVSDGNSASLTFTSSGIAVGTGDFTFDCWVYLNSYAYFSAMLIGTINAGKTGWAFATGSSINGLKLSSNLSGSWADNLTVNAGDGIPTTTWTHIALEREGGTIRIYKNGNMVKSGTGFGSYNFSGSAGIISKYNDGDWSAAVDGYLDEIRFSNTARYGGSNFTAPTVAYS